MKCLFLIKTVLNEGIRAISFRKTLCLLIETVISGDLCIEKPLGKSRYKECDRVSTTSLVLLVLRHYVQEQPPTVVAKAKADIARVRRCCCWTGEKKKSQSRFLDRLE